MTKTKHSVHDLTYHIVLVTKYRKPCINDAIREKLTFYFKRSIESNGGEIVECNFDIDHAHLLVKLPPTCCLATMIGNMKLVSSRMVRKEFQGYLKQYLYGDSFWSDSYYVSTAGGATIDIIKQYIENQDKPKRKYTKHSS